MNCRLRDVRDVLGKSVLNELETAPVEEGVLLLRFADVQMINIHLDQFSDAQICRDTKGNVI